MPGTPAPGADAQPPYSKEALRDKVRELATVSADIEMLTRQLAHPHSTVQVGFLKGRMDELIEIQRAMVVDIVSRCPRTTTRSRFEALDDRLQSLRSAVRDSRDATRLEEIRQQIDPLVDEWAQVFQDLVTLALKAD